MTQLEEARKLYQTANADQRYVLESLFPELKESEDERIRKGIIKYLSWIKDKDGSYMPNNMPFDDMIAWLEKQGEQKPFDYENANIQQKDFAPKVEPKFKVGDYIISNNNSEIIYHITGIGINELGNPDYVCEHVGREKEYNGKIYNMSQDKVDANFRLWTIQDAKGGDVLVNWNNTAFIFKAIEDETVKFHIAYNENWDAIKTPSTKLSHLGLPEPQFEFHPATKEQHDTLIQAMTDAGYTFDFEKKELGEIEQKPWSEEVQEEQVSEEFINALGTMLNDGLPDRYLVSEERIKMSAELLFSIACKQLNRRWVENTAENAKEQLELIKQKKGI